MINKRKVILKNITSCSIEQKKEILKIRNQEGIRNLMYTDHLITEEEHFSWLNNLKGDNSRQVYLVLNEGGNVIGMVSLIAIDLKHKKADWAYYLDLNERGGLGAALEWHFINYVFSDVKLQKLNCEVIETNSPVVKLHKKFAFIEEGFRRKNIEKNGERIGVYFLGLTQEDWQKNKNTIFEKYKKLFSKFEIKLQNNI